MMRWRLLLGLAGGALAVGILFVCLPGRPGDLVCRHVSLQDSVSGITVQGAEDLALDPLGGRLILSAYDRRGDEAGGLYAVSLARLLDPAAPPVITAQRLVPLPGGPPLRPHGFGLGKLNGETVPVAVIARTRNPRGGYDATVRAHALGRDGIAPAGQSLDDPRLCSANDVAVPPEGGPPLVTTDRGSCRGAMRIFEDVLGLSRGRVLAAGADGLKVLAQNIAFANGIVMNDAQVFVAATRGRALLVFDRTALRASQDGPPTVLPLPAAPDNLAFGDDGYLYIAAHVSLLRFAAFRAGLRGDSASEILRVDPARPRAVERLGRVNRAGAVSGATAALAVGGKLVVGAGFGEGLSVCARPGTAAP